MTGPASPQETIHQAAWLENSCSLLASAFSEGRRNAARLMGGQSRSFGLSSARSLVHIPFPALESDWTTRTFSCGVALQCAPSKDLMAHYAAHMATPRELRALTLSEAMEALGWIARLWPGLMPELQQRLHDLRPANEPGDATSILNRAEHLARSQDDLSCPPLLGRLPLGRNPSTGLLASLRRMHGQMPWSSKRPLSKALHTIPVGGQGGVRNPNLPPPSRPEDEDPEIRSDRRAGLPYPEWNAWTGRFLKDHVAVLERKVPVRRGAPSAASADLRRWFEEHTHRSMRNRLDDGSDIDIERYIDHHVDILVGRASEARVFRDLQPSFRDVTTALLLDGSSSLGAQQGRIFKLELACADALCHAMARARERHGLFLFSGNTRHRVDVACLKDFDDPRTVTPGDLGLLTGGYTRLGAPIRHLTSRLLREKSERRLLIVIGDGLMSDEGYEGRYAWADVAHAREEAEEAGVLIYYIGVGPTRVDPLPEIFGPRRSTRLRRVEELPRALARVHRELIAA